MKIVIIGGSGLIGTKVANILRSRGHTVNQASPSTGVNSLTGEGLAEALAGADVVLDVANSPSFEPAAVLSFFDRATGNLMEAEAKAGVRHHVGLSIVGLELSPDNGYFPGKLAQEARIKAGGIPYTIVRSTQFLEFLGGIADSMTVEGTVHGTPGAFQPIAAEDVARFVADAVCAEPINGTFEIAGPEKAPMSEFLARFLAAKSDHRKVVADKASKYFGSVVDEQSLVPLGPAKLGRLDFNAWFQQNSVPAA